MDKLQYFRMALRAGRWAEYLWVVSLFSIRASRTYDPSKNKPYDLVILDTDPDHIYAVLEDTTKTILVEDMVPNEPPFATNDVIVLAPGDLANVDAMTKTTCGTAILNAVILVYAFGKKIPYMAERLNGGKIDKIVVSKWVDKPDDYGTDQEDPNAIYVQEFLKYATAASNVAQFTQICAPSASPKTLTVSKRVIERRDQLIAEYGERLRDPATLAIVVAELGKMDMEDFKGDAAEGFFLKEKSFFISRMKEHILYGLEYGLDKSAKPAMILSSLAEGMDLETFPSQVDGIRAGSYDRGSQTALGGAAVKEIYRAMQNSKIVEGDCGTTVGRNTYIRTYNIPSLIGRMGIDSKTGKPVPLTKELLLKNLGKRLMIRSPMGCRHTQPSYCSTCTGKSYAMNENGAPIIVAEPASVMMNDMMKSMHGRTLKTERYNFRESMT